MYDNCACMAEKCACSSMLLMHMTYNCHNGKVILKIRVVVFFQTQLEKIHNLSLSTPSSRNSSLKQLQKECQQLSVCILQY